MWLKNTSTRVGLAGLTALAMVISTGGIAQAYEDSSLNAVSTNDSLAAEKSIELQVDELHELIEPTTIVDENLAYSSESNVLTALPTYEDEAIQTVKNDITVEFNLPEFGWSAATTPLPKLVNQSQDLLTNPTNDGVQLLWTIHDGKEIEKLRINADVPDDTEWIKESDGSLALVRHPNNEVTEVLMTSERPWALDATGRSLPTYYDIVDGEIIQYVDTTGAAFPVVADPNWAWWGSLALCIADIATIFVPGTQVIKAAKATKAAALLAKSPRIKKAVDALGGLNAAITKFFGKLRGVKYGNVTERALTKLLEAGKERFFDVLGIGGCYGVYVNW